MTVSRVYVHPVGGTTSRERIETLLDALRPHHSGYEGVDREEFVSGDASTTEVPLAYWESTGEWLTVGTLSREPYERKLVIADLLGALVTHDAFDWAVVTPREPTGEPTADTIGEITAVGGDALDRIGTDRLATAPGFVVFERSNSVAHVAHFGDDPDAVDAVKAYLGGSSDDAVGRGAPIQLDAPPSVGDDPVALLDAVGDWPREDVSPKYMDDPTERLTELLDDDRDSVRREAVWGLKQLYDDDFDPQRCIEPLFELAANDPNPEVQRMALTRARGAARQTDDPDHIQRAETIAVRLLRDHSDPTVRIAAEDTLSNLLSVTSNRDELLTALRTAYNTDPVPEVRAEVLSPIVLYDDDADILFDGLDASSEEVRASAATMLKKCVMLIGSPLGLPLLIDKIRNHTDTLSRALSSDDDNVRAAALEAVGLLDPDADTNHFVETMREADDDETKAAAARALEHIGDASALPALVDALEATPPVRTAAIGTIETIYERESVTDPGVDPVPAIIDVVTGIAAGSEEDREDATEALGAIGDERAIDPLVAAVDEGRLDAGDGFGPLGEIGGPATDILIDRLRMACAEDEEKEEDDVQTSLSACAKGLAASGDERGFDPLLEVFESGPAGSPADYHLARGLARTGGERAIEPLLSGLRAGRSVAVGFGEIGSEAVEPLLAFLEEVDREREVASEAVDALGRTGDPEAISFLLRSLPDADPDLQSDICRALGHANDIRLVPVCDQLASESPHEAVRESADVAAYELKGDLREDLTHSLSTADR